MAPTKGKPPSKTIDFALRVVKQILLDQINSNGGRTNGVCSPLSINIILNLLTSSAHGATLQNLLDVLGAKTVEEVKNRSSNLMSLVKGLEQSKEDLSIIFSLVNGLWVNGRICLPRDDYVELARSVYQADVNAIDFRKEDVVSKVNIWAEQATKGLIKDVLEPGSVSKKAILILTNALYFKAKWWSPFWTSETEDQEFHLLGGGTIQAPFMNKSEQWYDYGSSDGYKVLEIPYIGRSFSMYIFLPDEKDGLLGLMDQLISQINHIGSMKLKETEISWLSIPKFKFEHRVDAKYTMKALGLTLPFSKQAELTSIFDCPSSLIEPVRARKVIHKCFIEVEEEGTQAAAVTVCELDFTYGPPPEVEVNFVADHPFMVIIKENLSDVILFVGIVLDPSSSHPN